MTSENGNTRTRAYSYLRFSTPEQQHGDSVRRQLEAARSFAKRHDLELDETSNFQDLGVSGYDGSNAEVGALRALLDCIKNGSIPKGSWIIVENLDRLTRKAPLKALHLLEEILEREITLGVVSPEQVHTIDSMNDTGGLVMVVLELSRAHGESSRKSTMVKASWAGKRQAAPFSKGPPAPRPRRSGRRTGTNSTRRHMAGPCVGS